MILNHRKRKEKIMEGKKAKITAKMKKNKRKKRKKLLLKT